MINKQLMEEWAGHLRDLKNRHFRAAADFGKFHRYTGIPLVILAATANAGIWSIVAGLQPGYKTPVELLLGTIATVVTVLSAVQAFLSFDKRSEMHKNAAMKYSSLGADLEILINSSEKVSETTLREIKDKWNVITENAPVLPERSSDAPLKRGSWKSWLRRFAR